MELEKYLRLKFLDYVHNENQVFVIIQSFTFNLDANTRIRVMENFWYDNAWICICTEYTGMNINFLDIMHIVQFKIRYFITLPELLAQLGQRERDKFCAAVAMGLVHPRQVLTDNVYILEYRAFQNLQLSVSRKNCEKIPNVIAQLYINKLQWAKIHNVYGKNWTENTVVFKPFWVQTMIDINILYMKNVFKLFSDLADYCNYCIYNHINAGQISEFNLHGVTVKQAIIYEKMLEYSELELFAKCDYLYTINPPNLKIIAVKQST